MKTGAPAGTEQYPGRELIVSDGHRSYIDPTFTTLSPHLPHVGRQEQAMRRESAYHEYQEMRGDAMPGKVDEKKWNEAKAAAKKQYPDWGDDSPRFWKVVSAIYKKMGGEFHSKAEKSLAFLETLERITPSFVADQRLWVKALGQSGITDISKATAVEILPRVPMLLRLYAEMGGQLQKSSMLDSIEGKTAAGIADQFEKAEAPVHKYVNRVAKPGGGFRYVYPDVKTGPGATGKPGQAAAKPREPKRMASKPQTAAAHVMERLVNMGGKKARAALQNVSYEHLRLLETHSKGNEGLSKLVSEEVSRRKAQAGEKFKKKTDPTQKSQNEDSPDFQEFAKSFYDDVRDTLAKSHPDWEMHLLRDRTLAQLKQMFKMR